VSLEWRCRSGLVTLPASPFNLSPDVAADTGIHIGDGYLIIKKGGPHGSYQYEVTGHALEDQLYLIGTVMPTISSAYGLQKPGIYINPKKTWISLRYQSKAVALFKHETLGLPNGRKRNLSIPKAFLDDANLMRSLARELLATYGLLGFYAAGRNQLHKYPRIQIKLKICPAIGQLASFLRNDLGLRVSLRSALGTHEGRKTSLQQILQVNLSEDIETWRREIGFSNPSHISRMMVFEALGECVPRSSIVDRLSFLCGYSKSLAVSTPIALCDVVAITDRMTRSFGFPRITGETIISTIGEINKRLRSNLNRRLPTLVNLEGPPAGYSHLS
jgi:hypothetical protein